jgi:hypothetical protein
MKNKNKIYHANSTTCFFQQLGRIWILDPAVSVITVFGLIDLDP